MLIVFATYFDIHNAQVICTHTCDKRRPVTFPNTVEFSTAQNNGRSLGGSIKSEHIILERRTGQCLISNSFCCIWKNTAEAR